MKVQLLGYCWMVDFTHHLFPLFQHCQYLHISSHPSSLDTSLHLVFLLWMTPSCLQPTKDTAVDYRKPVEAENPKIDFCVTCRWAQHQQDRFQYPGVS